MIGLLADTDTTDIATDANGRLQVGDTSAQNKYFLLSWEKGSVKRMPHRCVGVNSYVESEDVSGLLREIKKEFTADGMKVGSVKFNGNDLEIDAEYE